MARALMLSCLLLVFYHLGRWDGATAMRQSYPVAVCPKVDARWIGEGKRRRLDTLTVIPETCR
jgi:hypothetical protein